MLEFIEIREEFLNPDQCKFLCNLYDEMEEHGSQLDYSYNRMVHLWDIQKQERLSEFGWMKKLAKRMRDYVVGAYNLEEPLYVEAVFLARLGVGGSHPLHRDNCLVDGRPNHTPQRDLSSLLYLNSGFKGGTLVFPNQGKVQPSTGLLVAFPSGINFPHQVEEVTKGFRYSMPVWYTFKPEFDMFRGQ